MVANIGSVIYLIISSLCLILLNPTAAWIRFKRFVRSPNKNAEADGSGFGCSCCYSSIFSRRCGPTSFCLAPMTHQSAEALGAQIPLFCSRLCLSGRMWPCFRSRATFGLQCPLLGSSASIQHIFLQKQTSPAPERRR